MYPYQIEVLCVHLVGNKALQLILLLLWAFILHSLITIILLCRNDNRKWHVPTIVCV